MKQLMKHFGMAIVAICSLSAVMVVLYFGIETPKGSVGLKEALGEVAQIEETTSISSASSAMQEVASRSAPTVSTNEKPYATNTEYSIVDIVTSTDTDGNYASVECVKVMNQKDEDVTYDVVVGKNIIFSQRGIYKIKINAIDNQGTSKSKWLAVGVE